MKAEHEYMLAYVHDKKNWPEVKVWLAAFRKDVVEAVAEELLILTLRTISALMKKHLNMYVKEDRYDDYNIDKKKIFYLALHDTIKHIEGIESYKHFKAYVFTLLEKWYKEVAADFPEPKIYTIPFDEERDDLSGLDYSMREPIFLDKFYQLSSLSQDILTLRFYGQYTHKQIACELERTEGTIKTRKSQNLKHLRNLYYLGEERRIEEKRALKSQKSKGFVGWHKQISKG